jgi:hypothetical protein
MFFRKLARTLALFAWLPLVLTTCGGASFDDPSVIKGLRVLAVQKSAPYPKPGEVVNLKLLFWDGKSTEDNPRNIFVLISPLACENPPGDLYYNCLAELVGGRDGGGGDIPDAGAPDSDTPDGAAATAATPTAGAAHGTPSSPGFVPIKSNAHGWLRNLDASSLVRASRPNHESAFHDIEHVRESNVFISPGIIKQRQPGVTPYGLAYVLFMACAGTPKPVPNAGPNMLPFGCFDAEDRQLGADDFVIGYTSMYVYNERVNNNPVIDDFVFNNASLAESTTDETRVPRVPSCKESDRAKCPKYALKPAINRDLTVETDDDPTAMTPGNQKLQEQVWVNYYITAGALKSSVRLVNDATQGWNEQHGAEFTAPAEPGPVRVFAVVHDNRGGVAWTEGKIIVD